MFALQCIALITMLHLGPRKHSPSCLGLAGVQEPHFLVLSCHLPCGLPWRVYQSLIIGASGQYSLLAFLHLTAICFLLTPSCFIHSVLPEVFYPPQPRDKPRSPLKSFTIIPTCILSSSSDSMAHHQSLNSASDHTASTATWVLLFIV